MENEFNGSESNIPQEFTESFATVANFRVFLLDE